jgi:drug/metabolite transporter (DMT)-like permease
MRLTPLRADAILLLAALLWGIAFVPQQLGMAHVGPLTFVGAKFALGALCMLPLLGRKARTPARARPAPRRAGPGSWARWPAWRSRSGP